VDLLQEQHEQVKRLFGQLEQLSDDARRDAFEQLVRLLAVHETAEEEVVYPAVRKMVDDGDDLADARTAEEGEAKTALSELEKMGIDHPDFEATLHSFQQLVLTHAENEEKEVFPQLRESHSREQLQSMATGVRAAESLAPTHPHPHGPESAVGNMAVGPFVAVADRVRDAIRSARR
jgi:hemerythrin superfamily protein